ncbi:MAG: ABC transporter permease, partial [Gammaproteobacteria bacterium]|nr:ABC transporter permease [Gammaproteobacteria bacterium]
MLAFYIVFELGLRQGEENYLAFLLTGLILWKWFASTITTSSGIINANRGLLNQVYLPKWIFPLTVVIGNTSKLLISCTVLILFLIGYG